MPSLNKTAKDTLVERLNALKKGRSVLQTRRDQLLEGLADLERQLVTCEQQITDVRTTLGMRDGVE